MPILILMDVTEQVGEYVGEILSDVELQERQSSKDDKKTDNHSIVIYETAARSKKSRGANIFTTDRTNELIFANDWREDVLNPREDKRNDSADDTAPSTKQNLNPVEVVSTEDGRPHTLYVVGEDPVLQGAELFIDYGPDYWADFRSELSWLAKLQAVEDALAKERKLRRVLERRVAELKKAPLHGADIGVQTEPSPTPASMEVETLTAAVREEEMGAGDAQSCTSNCTSIPCDSIGQVEETESKPSVAGKKQKRPKPVRLPGQPKKPICNFLRFVADVREGVTAANPGKRGKELDQAGREK
jgi:hypothetical protein